MANESESDRDKARGGKPQFFYSVARQFHDPSGRLRVVDSPSPKEVAELSALTKKALEHVASFIPIEGRYSPFRGRHDWQTGAYWIAARESVNRLAERLRVLADGSNRAQLGWLSLAQNAARWELRDATYALLKWVDTASMAAGMDTRPDLPADVFQRFEHAAAALSREFPEQAVEQLPSATLEKDAFDHLGIAGDLTVAARAANRCAVDGHRLASALLLGAHSMEQERARKSRRISDGAADPAALHQIEFPESMCQSGAAVVARLSTSCQTLRAALATLGSTHVGLVDGPKRMGTVNGISYHDVVLNWGGYFLAEVTHRIWTAGQAAIITDKDQAAIAEHWPRTAESVAKSDTVVKAQDDVNRVLPLIVEEAVKADRQRKYLPQQLADTRPITSESVRKARVTLGDANVVLLDGEPIAVRPNGYKLIELLLEAPGEYVPITSHGLRTRDVEALPEKLRDAIESDPGAGTRIKRKYLV